MTPLATDGPGSGSGAGFGRDHAEKWQSDGVSRTTLMVTNVTSLAGLNRGSQPRGHPHRAPSSHQIPPVQATVVERERRAADLTRPAQDTHLPVPDPPGGRDPCPPAQDAQDRGRPRH